MFNKNDLYKISPNKKISGFIKDVLLDMLDRGVHEDTLNHTHWTDFDLQTLVSLIIKYEDPFMKVVTDHEVFDIFSYKMAKAFQHGSYEYDLDMMTDIKELVLKAYTSLIDHWVTMEKDCAISSFKLINAGEKCAA